MSPNLTEVAHQALALPVSDRILLAQKLWDSLEEAEESAATDDESETLREAGKRDAELSRGSVTGRSHEEVMEAARKTIGCE